MFSKRNILALVLGGLFYSALAQSASAVTSTVVVTPGDMATSFADVIATPTKWFLYNDETDAIDNSLGSFVSGPAGVPFGTESVQIGVLGTQRRNLATYQFSGTPLGDITELSFYTYNSSAGNPGSVNRSGYLNFNVDFNGTDTWQRRLVFVPSMNGTVTQNMWQKWDALQSGSAQWLYSGATWPVTGQPGSTPKTWSQILTDYPGARIRVTDSFLGLRVGEPYPDGYTENLDGFTFATSAKSTTFDFDAVAEITPPTSKSQCTNDGWKLFNNPAFASKKECEKYVKDHKKDGKAEGNIYMGSPRQKIKFNLSEMLRSTSDHDDDDDDHEHGKKPKSPLSYGNVEYWNFDYVGGLHYKTEALCVSVNKATKEARFMFQIPNGFPGLSGLYVVSYVKDAMTKHGAEVYGHAATSSEGTARAWCETGAGYSPTLYSITKGELSVK